MKILLLLTTLSFPLSTFASDKGVVIQKKITSARKGMKKCLEYEGRQTYPTFKVKFAVRGGSAKEISFPDSELKDAERACLEGLLQKIDFEGVDGAQVEQTVNFKSQAGS